MTGSLGACAGHCGVLVDAAPSRGDDYIALDLARGMRRICAPSAAMRKYADCLVSRQVAAATSSRTGHDARSPAQPVNVRPLPEGPPWCELNPGGAAARSWMARDARAGQDDW